MFFKRVEILYKAFGEKSETTLEYGGIWGKSNESNS
jgi:hypothetical protein